MKPSIYVDRILEAAQGAFYRMKDEDFSVYQIELSNVLDRIFTQAYDVLPKKEGRHARMENAKSLVYLFAGDSRITNLYGVRELEEITRKEEVSSQITAKKL